MVYVDTSRLRSPDAEVKPDASGRESIRAPSSTRSRIKAEQSLDSLSRPAVSSDSFAAVQRRERDAFAETNQRLDMIISRESSTVRNAQQAKKDSGWFGSLSRAVTLSDPYKIEIQNARRTISTAKHARSFIEQAQEEKDPLKKVELLNQARRLAGMREVKPGSFSVKEEGPRSTGLNRVSTDSSHFELEQEAITVTRDVAITTVVTVGTLGGGAAGSLAAKGTQVAAQSGARVIAQAAFMGGLEAGAESTARNIDDVRRGEVTTSQAVQRVAKDTAIGTAFGGAIGSAAHGIGRGISRLRQGTEAVEEGAEAIARKLDDQGSDVADSVIDDALAEVAEETAERQAKAAAPTEALEEDDIMDRILNSPSIEHERNARMIVQEGEEMLAGVGASTSDAFSATADMAVGGSRPRGAAPEIGGRVPDVRGVDANAGNLRNSNGTGPGSGPGSGPSSGAGKGAGNASGSPSPGSSASASNSSGPSSSASRAPASGSRAAAQSNAGPTPSSTPAQANALSMSQAEDMFMDAAETVQRLARGEVLPYAEQVKLMKDARQLAENGFDDVLEALKKSPDFKNLEMAELADALIHSKNVDKALTAEQQIALNNHLFPADGSNPFPEITEQITKRQRAKLERTASGPKPEAPLAKQLAGKNVRDVMRAVEADGWEQIGQVGSHRQYKHPTKPGRVTINGKESDVFGDALLKSVLKQAGLD